MSASSLGPVLLVTADRIQGRTPSIARIAWLWSFDRRVTIDRRLRRVTIETRRFWGWRDRRVVPFDQINRIVLRVQRVAGSVIASIVSFGMLPGIDSAFFLVSLGLRDSVDDVNLFTIWENEEDGSGWFDSLLSGAEQPAQLGDEGTAEVLRLLREYVGVPVSSH